MHKAGKRITLVIPGLCGPGSDAAFLKGLTIGFPALERLLSRSTQSLRSVNGLDSSLCSHFNLDGSPSAGLPVAALTSLVDIHMQDQDVGYMMRADPVHLRADQRALRLFDSRVVNITQDEADALTSAFNELYADKDWTLLAPCPQRWYLKLPVTPAITTVSLAMVAGEDIDPHLPHGADATEWHAVMNEIQMLFHQHPVNTLREAREEPTINSVWLWGEGSLPADVSPVDFQVVTDYPLAMGLARFTDTPRCDVVGDLDELLGSADAMSLLVVLDELDAAVQYSEVEHWLGAMEQLELHWFAPLLEALGDGRVTSVEVDPCSGKTYQTSRRQQWHFWKRVRPLATVCHHG